MQLTAALRAKSLNNIGHYTNDLEDIRSEAGFSLEYIEIDDDPDLEARYGLKVPVLMAEEREICHYTLDIVTLRDFLEN